MLKKYPAPHIRKEMSVRLIYPNVLAALLPAMVSAVYYYGLRVLLLLLVGMSSYAVSDYLFIRYGRREKYSWNASSLVSGAILVMILPPTVPVWILLIGVFFASVVVKQCFGGLGCNLFNPALAARGFLTLAFPSLVSVYAEPLSGFWKVSSFLLGPADAVSSATPLTGGNIRLFELLSGRYPGAVGETCAVAILIGGIYLFSQGILRIQAPAAFLGVIIGGYCLFHGPYSTISGLLHLLLTGGVLFCGVFAIGDYSTTPATPAGRAVFGAGAGLLTLLIRYLGNPSYAVGFAVLAMNAATPIIDFYIRPRTFSLPGWFSIVRRTPGTAREEDRSI